MGQEIVQAGQVGQVAAPVAGQAQLGAQAAHPLQQHDRRAGGGSLPGGHQAGRATADYDHRPDDVTCVRRLVICLKQTS